MAVVEELLRSEADGAVSFGNHTLAKKAKLEDFRHQGDILKVKTSRELTRLEKNGSFLYESVPGTSVLHFMETEDGVEFAVEGIGSAQITVGLTDNMAYEVYVNGKSIGVMSSGMSGKLSLNADLENSGEVQVKIVKE